MATNDRPRPEYAIVEVERFFVDPSYQRPLTSLANQIAEDFDRTLVGVIIGSERKVRAKANVAIIDGQTRWSGARDAGEDVLPAVVFTGLSPADEARIFADIQSKRRNLSSFQRFNAQVIAGHPMASKIQSVVEAEGFRTGNANLAGQDSRAISAVAALESVYAMGTGVGLARARMGDGNPELGQIHLDRTLRVLKEGFPTEEPGYISGEMIRGMGAFLARNEDVDDARLIKRLRSTRPSILVHRANMLKEGHATGGSGAKYMAEAILSEYSKRG